uniref:Uncharacterized protein n=1 Tax=Setaria italica TaxID=4555 RepID=K3YL63_SETIT
MRRVCGDRAVSRRVPARYATLLTHLTLIGNPDVCFYAKIPSLYELSRAVAGGHNTEAYLVTIILYRNNGGTGDDDTTRWYVKRIEGEEDSTMSGGSGPRMLSNKGCQLRGDVSCAGSNGGITFGWPQKTLFCSKDCRICREIVLFQRKLGIDN